MIYVLAFVIAVFSLAASRNIRLALYDNTRTSRNVWLSVVSVIIVIASMFWLATLTD
jgi:hypothetical protein